MILYNYGLADSGDRRWMLWTSWSGLDTACHGVVTNECECGAFHDLVHLFIKAGAGAAQHWRRAAGRAVIRTRRARGAGLASPLVVVVAVAPLDRRAALEPVDQQAVQCVYRLHC